MSGEPVKHRVITSGRLVSPVACCRDFDARALRFKQSINGSVYSGRLQADIAVKALGWDISRKQDEGNTDNKKREFTGESMPGVEKNAYGYRWKPEARWEPGSKLVLSPTIFLLHFCVLFEDKYQQGACVQLRYLVLFLNPTSMLFSSIAHFLQNQILACSLQLVKTKHTRAVF